MAHQRFEKVPLHCHAITNINYPMASHGTDRYASCPAFQQAWRNKLRSGQRRSAGCVNRYTVSSQVQHVADLPVDHGRGVTRCGVGIARFLIPPSKEWSRICGREVAHIQQKLAKEYFDIFAAKKTGRLHATVSTPGSLISMNWAKEHQVAVQIHDTSSHSNVSQLLSTKTCCSCIPPRMLPVPGSAAGQWPSVLRAWAGWKSDRCEKATRPTNRPCWACRSPWHPNDPPAPQWCNLCSPARLPCWRSPCRASDMPLATMAILWLPGTNASERLLAASDVSHVHLDQSLQLVVAAVASELELPVWNGCQICNNMKSDPHLWSKTLSKESICISMEQTTKRAAFQFPNSWGEVRMQEYKQPISNISSANWACKVFIAQMEHWVMPRLVDGLGMWTGRRVPALNLNSGCAQLSVAACSLWW